MVDYPRIRVNKQTPTPRIRLRVLPATLPLNVSMQATATEIQWRVGNGPWQDLIAISAFGGATVTTVSVVSANGLAGTVADPTTTPALTLSTTVTGVIKGDGTALSAATGADLPAMTATVGGAVPTPPNNTTTFLRGDGTFATPAGAGTVTHTAGALTANAVVLGNGAADLTVLASLGTTTTVLHGNAAGAPSFGAVAIGTDVSGLGTGIATFLGTPSSANLAAALTDETGTGAAVFATSPTLVTPILGTPTSGTLTNATGLPISTGVSGLAAGVAAFLATPSSANLITAVTDETGTGALVFATSPTLVTPALGTPASGVATNLTGTAASLTSGITQALKSATTTVDVSAATAPTSGQVLQATGGTAATWQTAVGLGVANHLAFYAAATNAVSSNAQLVMASASALQVGVAASTLGQLKLSNTTSGVTTLSPGATAAGTLTLPAGTDTLIGKATTDTLTNKTFDTAGAGNSFSINSVAITTNTGTGANVLATSPTLVTPTLGVATATSVNKMAITAPATSSTLAVADGKTLTASNTMTLVSTDGQTWTFPAASSNVLTTGNTATITKGYTLTPNNLGNIGNFTIDPSLGNYQYGTNHAAATWTAPASDCAVTILVTNDATAGTITFSGFTVGSSTGDALTNVNTNKFLISIIRINAISTYFVKALQ